MQDGTYPTRNFATLGPFLTYSRRYPSPPPCMEAGGEGGVEGKRNSSTPSGLCAFPGRRSAPSDTPSPPPCMEAGGEGVKTRRVERFLEDL